jgi:hypothetical protein
MAASVFHPKIGKIQVIFAQGPYPSMHEHIEDITNICFLGGTTQQQVSNWASAKSSCYCLFTWFEHCVCVCNRTWYPCKKISFILFTLHPSVSNHHATLVTMQLVFLPCHWIQSRSAYLAGARFMYLKLLVCLQLCEQGTFCGDLIILFLSGWQYENACSMTSGYFAMKNGLVSLLVCIMLCRDIFGKK